MNKSVIITGSSGSIGKAICTVFREAGFSVIGVDIRPETSYCDNFVEADLNKLCKSSGYVKTTVDSIRKSAASPINVLINNAAVQVVKSMEKLSIDDWQNTMNINVIAPFLLVQALTPDLRTSGGCVINIASVHAFVTKPRFMCYATSKAALIGLTRSMAVELGPEIRVNAISPAAVTTPMLMAGFQNKEKMLDQVRQAHPLARIALPEEIANVALFLASDAAGFITGASYSVDGGITARLHDPE